MPAALADIDYLAGRPEFLARVRAAMVKAAVAVGAESGDVAQEHFRLRRALSVNVLAAPEVWAPRFALAVATNPVITMTSNDGDIEFTCDSMWNAMAGAGPDPA